METTRFQRFTLALLVCALFFCVAAYLRLERLHSEDRRIDYGSLQAAAALMEKQLFQEAADEFSHYLGRADLPDSERRRVMLSLAHLLAEKAEDWRGALAVLTRMEALWPNLPEKDEINKLSAVCLARLGRSLEADRLVREDTTGGTGETKLDKPVARIGEEFMNRDRFEKLATELPRAFRISLENREQRLQALQQVLQQMVIRKEAEALDLDNKPEYITQRKEMETLLLRQHLLVDRVLSHVNVDAQAEKYYYEAHADDYRAPGSYKARVWTFADDTAAVEFDNRLNRKEPGAEATVAAPLIVDEAVAARELGKRLNLPYDLTPLLKGKVSGERVGPLKTPRGTVIIRLDEVVPGALPPLDQVRDLVRSRLLEEKQQTELGNWFQKKFEEYKIRIYEESLD